MKRTHGLRLGRHDQARDELARALKGIRGLRAARAHRGLYSVSQLISNVTLAALISSPNKLEIGMSQISGPFKTQTKTQAKTLTTKSGRPRLDPRFWAPEASKLG